MAKRDYALIKNQRKYCVGLPKHERRYARQILDVKRLQKEENKRFRHANKMYMRNTEDFDESAEPKEHLNVDELAYYTHLW